MPVFQRTMINFTNVFILEYTCMHMQPQSS